MTAAPQHTFLFADLAGYTALTEVHGDAVAAEIALALCAEIDRQLPECGEDIKMLGDACLIRTADADCALRLGVDLGTTVAPRHGFPALRVGIHTGTAVRRGTDWFGNAINVAARVVDVADPGEVLLTDATRRTAGNEEGLTFKDRGAQELRHLREPQQLWGLVEASADENTGWTTDPVCRMRVAPEKRAAVSSYEGAEYSFCPSLCSQVFAENPQHYAQAQTRF